MRPALTGFLLLCSLNVSFSQGAGRLQATSPQPVPRTLESTAAKGEATCPNRRKLRNFCMMVGSRTPNDDPVSENQFKYMYQKRLREAGCVDESKDTEQVQVEKMQLAWRMYQADLKCNASTFDVRDGHIVKYAIAEKFDEFIDDVIGLKLNLDDADSSDGMTVLDYVRLHIERNTGTPLEKKYREYYEKLRRAGAKHRSELAAP